MASMAGRESRRELLAPSFILMATALACGGAATGSGGPGEGEHEPSVNPPVVGGSGGSGGSAGSGGVLTGVGGSNPPAPACPPGGAVPGEPCDGRHGPAQPALSCPYVACGVPAEIACVDNRWEIPEIACNPPTPFTCPPEGAVPGEACDGRHGPAEAAPSCPYTACDGTVVTISCVNDQWEFPEIACNPPPTGEAGAGGAVN